MTYRTQTARLMRRLGFVADPKEKPQILRNDQATYWRHQPSQACVATMHDQRYAEAMIVRMAISAGIHQVLREVDAKVGPVVGNIRRAYESQAIDFAYAAKKRV